MATNLLEAPTLATPQSALACSPMPELRRLTVFACSQQIRITGTVSTYYLKQLAQEAVRSTADGRKIVNQVLVASRDE
jgi:hypothetical protein